MTENTATPITQAQIDFVKNTMTDRGLDVSNIPDPNEGETVEEWFDRSIAQYNEIAQNSDLGEQAYLYSGMTYVADNANLSASYLSTMKHFVVNDFASMPGAAQVAFLQQHINENIKPAEHGVLGVWPEIHNEFNLDLAADHIMQSMGDTSLCLNDFKDSENPILRQGIISLHGLGISYEEIDGKLGFDIDENKYNDRMKTQQLCAMSCYVAKASRGFPEYEEPVVEKPLGMATTSKDHRDRINQWMKYLGKADQAQALVDKYGVEVAYKICQQSMLAPAELKDVTGGNSLSSKDAVQYFLDAKITPEFLESETGAKALAEALDLDTAVVQESVWSANRELFLEPTLKTEEIEIPVNMELNREVLHAELASMTPSEETIDPTVYLNDKKFQRELARDTRRAERKGVSVEEYREDKAEKQAARKAKREAFAAEVREFWGL